jgi:NTE family protein
MLPTLRAWLTEAPFSLSMSAGFFGFFAHTGVVSVLENEGLQPRRLFGASAGALVTGLWGAGVSGSTMREELFLLKRQDFWDPWPGPGLLRGRLFRQKLDALLPNPSFDRCRLPVSISVFDVADRKTIVLRSGPLAPAIQASCALPGLFHPVRIANRAYLDGGILDRPALAGADEGERIFYHHLASRSPWRRPGSPALQVPTRLNTATLLIADITRVHPFALDRGRIAYDQAARAFSVALDKPLDNGIARIAARE